MHLQIIHDPIEWKKIESDWDRLTTHLPSISFSWLYGWWEAYGAKRNLHICVCRNDQAQVVGIAPWFLEPTLGFTTLKFLGSGKACSDYPQVLFEPDAAAEVHATLNLEINRLAKSSRFLGCQFEGVLFDQLQSPAWGARVVPEKFIAVKTPMEACWQIDLPSTWEEHLAVLYSSYRRKIKRCVDRVDKGELQLHHARQPQEWARAFEIYHSLHRARRAKIGDRGCFDDLHFRTFLERAIPAMMAKQQAHLSWVESQGSPIAVGLFLTAPGYIGMYQSGIEPSAMHLDPGHTLAACVIRESIRNGLHTFDFMRGDESYKSQWRAKPRTISKVDCIAPNVAARAFARVRETLRTMKHQLKEWRTRNPSTSTANDVATHVSTASRPAS